MGKQRIEWIDIAKGFSIILVVYGHCGLSSIPYIGDWFAAFRMPFFFFVSGLLFNPDKYIKSTDFVKRKWPTLLRPFIIFSIIVFGCFYFIDITQFNDRVSQFGKLGWGGYALWFIPVLFTTEFLYLLVCKSILSNKGRLCAITILALIGFITYKFAFPNIWNLNFALTATLFFGLGSIMCKPLNSFLDSWSMKQLGTCLIILFTISLSFLFNKPKPEFFVNCLGGVYLRI